MTNVVPLSSVHSSARRPVLAGLLLLGLLPWAVGCAGTRGEVPAGAGEPAARGTQPEEATALSTIPAFLASGEGDHSFAVFAKALRVANMVGDLEKPGPFTVFVPTDAAFAKLPGGGVEELLADQNALRELLAFHVVPGELPSQSVAGMEYARTLQRIKLPIEADASGVRVGGAAIQARDLRCANGIVHIVDTVMFPELRKR